jgi:hypothetical protein
MKWLRVELLRLRSFDWGPGSHRSHWLKEGVATFSSFYSTSSLTAKFGITEDELLRVIESHPVVTEVEGKSFTIGWKEGCITLSWLEEGISEWKTEITHHYYEEGGKYYSEFRMTDKIVYLDGTERVMSDTGKSERSCVTEEAFNEVMERMRRNSGKQE